MFQTHTDADEAGGDVDGLSFRFGQFCMCGAGRVRSDAAGIAQVGCERQHLQAVQETASGFQSALQFKTNDTAAILHLLGGNGMVRMAGQEGITQ